jgi:hypothetical protein
VLSWLSGKDLYHSAWALVAILLKVSLILIPPPPKCLPAWWQMTLGWFFMLSRLWARNFKAILLILVILPKTLVD